MRMLRVAQVLVTIFIIQLLFSLLFTFHGCVCSEPAVLFNIDSISIRNIDNSGTHAFVTESNTMHSCAVAFSVKLADKNQDAYYYRSQGQAIGGTGFSTALATSIDCYPVYVAKQRVVNVSVITLHNINSAIQSGSNVTDLFLARSETDNRAMYSTIGNVLTQLNSQSFSRPAFDFNLFLKVPVNNSIARFVLSVSLSDGTHLCDTTNLITIIPPGN